MNQFFTNLQKQARALRLTQDEKQRMRVNLYEAIKLPAPLAVSKSPISTRRIVSPYHFFSIRLMVPVCAVLIVVLGSGTAFAAQGALPGDALYVVKINVNEQVQSALALSDTAKVEVHAELAQKRLEEAETLAAAGKLTASTSLSLAENFDQHLAASQTIAENLSEKDPDAASELSVHIDSSLSAHGAILAQLGDDSNNAQTKEDSNSLAEHVRSRSHGSEARASDAVVITTTLEVAPQTFVATAPGATTFLAKVASSAVATDTAKLKLKKSLDVSSKQQAAALRLQAQASSTLDQAQKDFLVIQKILGTSTIVQVEAQFALAAGLMQQGSTSMATRDYVGASESFTNVVRMATRLDAYLKAGKKFNKNILSSLLTSLSDQQEKKGTDDADTGKKGSDSSKGKNDPREVLGTTTSSTASSTLEIHGDINEDSTHGSSSEDRSQEDSHKSSFFHTLLNNL